MIDVSVIIVSYNTKELTSNAVSSVFDKTYGVKYEVIVVDNSSKDGSPDYLKSKFKDKIIVIENDSNLGFGSANNIGIKRSKGKYVFLLNSDTELLNNSIKIFFDYMEQHSQVGVCGGNLYDINTNPATSYCMYTKSIISYMFWKFFQIVSKIPALITGKKFYCNFNYTQNIKEVGYISGADMFIRKEVLNKSGLFDENIFMYGDDIDLNFRIRDAGYLIKSISQAQIMHIDHASFKEDNDEKIISNYRIRKNNEYKFYFKIFGKKTSFIYFETQINNIIKILTNIFLPEILLKKIYLKVKSTDIYKKMLKIDREEYIKAKFAIRI